MKAAEAKRKHAQHSELLAIMNDKTASGEGAGRLLGGST